MNETHKEDYENIIELIVSCANKRNIEPDDYIKAFCTTALEELEHTTYNFYLTQEAPGDMDY